MRHFKFILPVLLSSASVSAYTSYVAPAKLLSKSGSEISFFSDYFKSSSLLNDEGTSTDFEDGAGFNRLHAGFQGSYGLTEDLEVSVGARLRSQTSTSALNNNSSLKEATAEGLESTWIKLRYAFAPVDRLQYTLEGEYRYRPYTNKEAQTGIESEEMILGDDGDSYSIGMAVTYTTPTKNYLSFRGGYRRAGQEISDDLYYEVEGAMAWERVALIAGINGYYSLGRDPYEDQPTARPIFNTGTTLLYNQQNAETTSAYAGINIAVAYDWRVELRASQVVMGKSTDMGTSFGVNILRRVSHTDPVRQVDKSFKSYDLEATITKISPKGGYVVIDKGLADDIEKGMSFDFYEFDYVGGNELLARGTVIKVQSDTSIIKITSRFKAKKPLKEGILGRSSYR